MLDCIECKLNFDKKVGNCVSNLSILVIYAIGGQVRFRLIVIIKLSFGSLLK